METSPVPMGGILDLATAQSDDIFSLKFKVNDSFSEIHKENMYEEKNYSEDLIILKDNSDSNEYKRTDDQFMTSEVVDSSSSQITKPLSPDIILFETKQKNAPTKNLPGDLPLQSTMISSICSSLAETPGDSGVLCLDSETSELTSEYPPGMSLSLVEAEELACDGISDGEIKINDIDDRAKLNLNIKKSLELEDVMTQSDIENQNIDLPSRDIVLSKGRRDKSCDAKSCDDRRDNLPDVVAISQEPREGKCSMLQKTSSLELNSTEPCVSTLNKPKNMMETMKSASDDIVYRRKCNKKVSNQAQPKKRVSFHEDILNSTKTDNIHIEHGFVMYRPEASMSYLNSSFKRQNIPISRYSWCTVGDNAYYDAELTSLGRNTRSDVLTYGKTDVNGYPDKSGIYEYQDDNYLTKSVNKSCDSETCVNKMNACKCPREDFPRNQNDSPVDSRQLYMCSCNSSDSNLSSESETSSSQTLSCNSDTNVKYNTGSKKCDNTQKSYSCDCIENNVSRPMMRTMYFSDADINNHAELNKEDGQLQMSEILPRASCLKKSSLKKKRYIRTDIIEEHDDSKNIKVDNRKGMRSLLDSKNLFGSLKNIYKSMNFGLTITERGVPEGSEDCQSVLEVLPPEIPSKTESFFLSKSFDTGFDNNYAFGSNREVRVRGDGHSRTFTHEVDNQLRRMNEKTHDCNFGSDISNEKETAMSSKTNTDISKQNLTLDMKANNSKTFLDWKRQNNLNLPNQDPFNSATGIRNKFIVNCESTVYEHKGVSYCYEYDAFKTTFDTSKDTFTPINDTIPVSVQSPSNKSKQQSDISSEPETSDKNTIKDNTKDDDSRKISTDIVSESDCSLPDNIEKVKLKVNKHILDQTDTKLGVSKHLSSPLRQKNIMRYEKSAKASEINKYNDLTVDTSSTQDTLNECLDLDETLEIIDINDFQSKVLSRKCSLMNRFLKNVGQKKALETKLQQNEFFQNKLKEESTKFPNICFPTTEKISPNFKAAAKYIDSLINKEIIENKRISVKLMTADEPSYFDSFEENVAVECCEKLKLELFSDSSETLHRMLKVRSVYSQETGQWTPLLVFITNKALYVADLPHGKTSYNLICFLTHDQLDTIVIGPDSQYVQIFDKSNMCRCILITGDRYLCHRLVSSLEWSSRNSRVVDGTTVILGSIPSIIWKKRETLKRALIDITSVKMFEACAYYGMVGSSSPGSCNTGRPASPFPPLEGFLMYKTEKQKYWRPSFFLLKSGVLSYGSSTPPTEPLSASCLPHSILLEGVLGVRRCTDLQGRPHCFEIALNSSSGSALQMAAPDDDTASQWLQALLMHAAQALEGPKIDKSKKTLPPCCTLLATSEHIITLREELKTPKSLTDSDITIKNEPQGDEEQDATDSSPSIIKNSIEILSCALIKDLTAFKIPDNDDNWCILEFVFCEVREGTEMGLLFSSGAELERFIGVVESLWHTTNNGVFPISVLPKSEAISGRCSDWHNCLVSAWDRMLPAAQR